jgi:predicted TPR repeat methyltransferase
LDTVVAEAVALHRQAKLEEAGEAYQRILNNEPDNADVLNYFGMLEFQRGNTDRGIELAEGCLTVDTSHASGCNNLANMYLSTYRLDEAERYYRKSIDMAARAVEPLYNMAIIEKARNKYTAAEEYFNKVLEINPPHSICLMSLADMYTKLGHFEPALQLLKSCLDSELSEEEQKSTSAQMARLCLFLDNQDAAIDVYQKMLSIYPDDPTATHMLAAITGLKVPEKPDERYVKDMFDRFAESFDKVLNKLEYNAPQQIQSFVEQLYKHIEPQTLSIVDAGCGTGLCGHYLKPLASKLIGVDLSPGMLKRAKYRDEYDELIEQDLNEYFRRVSNKCDLIVSADTLCYWGLNNQ